MTTPDPSATPPTPDMPSAPPPVAPPPVTTPPAVPPPAGPSSAPPASAARPPRTGIVAGVILIVIGTVFLAGRLLNIALGPDAWPLWIILPGLGLFLASFAVPPRSGLGLAIPGAIITIIGLILWVQATYDVYATWAYAWALVAPTGPGIAMLIYGTVKGDGRMAAEGLRTTVVGLALFTGFALFFEGVIGLSGGRIAGLDDALPVIVIGLGLVLVVLSLFGRRGGERQA